jgi:hypothetical protein
MHCLHSSLGSAIVWRPLRAILAHPSNAPELQNNRWFAVLDEKRAGIDPQMCSICNFFCRRPHVYPPDLHIPSFFDQTERDLHPCEAMEPMKFQLQPSLNHRGTHRNLAKIHRSLQNPTKIEHEMEGARAHRWYSTAWTARAPWPSSMLAWRSSMPVSGHAAPAGGRGAPWRQAGVRPCALAVDGRACSRMRSGVRL